VFQRIDPEALEGIEVEFLDVKRRGFHDDLVLVVVLEPVRVFAIAAVRRSSGGLHIGHPPGFRSRALRNVAGLKVPAPLRCRKVAG